jgi:uncharacterized membrane protein YdcZ (DUF606 family)
MTIAVIGLFLVGMLLLVAGFLNMAKSPSVMKRITGVFLFVIGGFLIIMQVLIVFGDR